jgi:hypothetical protein
MFELQLTKNNNSPQMCYCVLSITWKEFDIPPKNNQDKITKRSTLLLLTTQTANDRAREGVLQSWKTMSYRYTMRIPLKTSNNKFTTVYFVHEFNHLLFVGRNLRVTDPRLVLCCVFSDVVIADRMYCHWMDIWYINYITDIARHYLQVFHSFKCQEHWFCANIWDIT